MRTWGRVPNPSGGDGIGVDFTIGESPIGGARKPYVWVEVDTDDNGFNDQVMLTTLIQVLKLNLNESPFYADFGIPAKDSVLQQIAPDFYANRTQQRFAPQFASLIITKETGADKPTYDVRVVFQDGTVVQTPVAT
jgi:hypothetical protein